MEIENKGNNHTKDCKVCHELIHIDAVKCIKCGSYQSWLRHLTISSSILALFVSIVTAVTSLSVINISLSGLWGKNEEINIGWSNTQVDMLKIWVVNDGNGTGVLEEGFEIEVNGTTYPAVFNPGVAGDNSWFIFEPGAKRVFYVRVLAPELEDAIKSSNTKINAIAFVNNPKGARRKVTVASPARL